MKKIRRIAKEIALAILLTILINLKNLNGLKYKIFNCSIFQKAQLQRSTVLILCIHSIAFRF